MTPPLGPSEPAQPPVAAHAAALLRDLYAVSGQIRTLPGELDRNLQVVGSDGRAFLLKIMRPGCPRSLVELQCAALERLREAAPALAVQRVVRTRSGALFDTVVDDAGEERIVWLLDYIEGRLWGETRPISTRLLDSLGAALATLDRALDGFDHPGLSRTLKWDLRNAAWIGDRLDAIADPTDRALVDEALAAFRTSVRPQLDDLPIGAIHGDANDYNLLVATDDAGRQSLAAIIDFGDAVRSNRVCEIAVAGAYALFDAPDPLAALAALVAGYHRVLPLLPEEIELVLPLVRTRLSITLVNAAIEKLAKPDDPYVVISERPARTLLRRLAGHDALHAGATLKQACGLEPLPAASRVAGWLQAQRGHFAPLLGSVPLAEAPVVDLSVGTLPSDPFAHDEAALRRAVDGALATAAGGIGLGRYGECRLIYTEPFFAEGPLPTDRQRTLHLGVDVFAPAGTALHAPLDGTVRLAGNNPQRQDYGPHLVLEHATDGGDRFHTLYGHLGADSIGPRHLGERITRGQAFAAVGTAQENGGWPPHLHLQLLTAVPAKGLEAPGVAHADDAAIWSLISPNPAALLNLPDAAVAAPETSKGALLERRRRLLGHNLSLSYSEPLHIVRGWRQYLFDDRGRCYLDVYNNVPHVGHCHPRVIEAVHRQMTLLNTNTRYLHETILDYAEALTAKMPERLSVCFFLNSASEANELALRLARAHTGARDVIVMDTAYHGNTTSLIDISPYKFDKPGGSGAPGWVHKTPTADPYRGPHKYADPEAGAKYAACVAEAIAAIEAKGRRLSAYICETLPSVGGQIVPPPGFMRAAFAHVRAAGGLCIADEVQAGFGRVGSHFWAFDMQGAEPDILVLGKPIGNGHPLGAVVTTPEIAQSFDNGIEFFSTFGGNPVSCAAGLAVLQVLEEEGLQAHAHAVGTRLLAAFGELKRRHPLIGDVRGAGLFLGLELVEDRATLAPATRQAAYIKNRLCARGILLGTEGPFDNVLKIRPPMPFSGANADHLVNTLDAVLGEAGAQPRG